MNKDTLKNYYLQNQKSDFFIIGWYHRGGVYATVLPIDTIVIETVGRYESKSGGNCYGKDKTTHNRTDVIRVSSASEKSMNKLCKMYEVEPYYICSKDTFNSLYKEFNSNTHKNRGYLFEKLIMEGFFNMPWVPSPIDKTGKYLPDIVSNDVKYQVKFNKATLISSSQVE